MIFTYKFKASTDSFTAPYDKRNLGSNCDDSMENKEVVPANNVSIQVKK